MKKNRKHKNIILSLAFASLITTGSSASGFEEDSTYIQKYVGGLARIENGQLVQYYGEQVFDKNGSVTQLTLSKNKEDFENGIFSYTFPDPDHEE
jgi:hypothetical protein